MFGEVNIPSKFQLPSSYCDLWYYEDPEEEKAHWLSELINQLDGVAPLIADPPPMKLHQ